jgi:hypothetical protein
LPLLGGMTCAASFLPSILRSLLALVFLAGASGQATAGDVHLLWDPNGEPDLAGYVLLYGTASGVYTQSMEIGPSTTEAQVNGLPAGATYYFAVRAINTAGQQSALSNEVSVSFAAPPSAPPQVTTLSPASGPTSGGTVVTITGSNFVPGVKVLFGSTPAVVTSLTSTTITATAPAHVAGPVTVSVVHPDGGLATEASAFTYVAQSPVLTSVSPSRGSVAGGNTVVLTGENFGPGTEVTFDGVVAPVLSVSATTLRVQVPARPMGMATVTVRNPDGRSVQVANAYLYDVESPSIAGLTPGNGSVDGGTLVSITGTNFVSGLQVRLGDETAQVVTVNADKIVVLTPPHDDGAVDVTVINPNGLEVTLGAAFRYDDATTEHTFTRYFAEGVLGTFFDTRFAFANPHDESVDVRATFTDPFGQETVEEFVVEAGSRFTLDRSNMPALANDAFGSRFEASREIGIDRTVMWDPAQPYGAHSETGIEAPRPVWYLAEGATHSGFNLFYLLQNPTDTVAEVLVRYMLGSGQVIERVHFVAARARTNIWVNKDDPALEAAEISAHLVSVNDVPIVVERSMYLNTGGQLFTAGHNSGGVNEPATRWFLAEGATGTYFDTFILVANPGTSPANVTVTYLLPSGAPVMLPYTVPAQSRFTIWVDQEHPALAATDFSAIVESTNGVPLIVERSMWWPDRPGGQWTEAHNSAGATTTASRWILADGISSTANQAATYALVANTSSSTTTVRFTLLGEAGVVRSVEQAVGGNARFSIDVAGLFSEALNSRFSLLVESLEGAPLVVERASYWNAGAVKWSAGTNSLAMPLKHAVGLGLLPVPTN